MKQYFPYNQKTEADFKQIGKLIFLSMNGITADNMKRTGIHYKQNFGVALPRLKEIASHYPQNRLLAERLFQSGVREMMLMATWLFPPTLFAENIFYNWIQNIKTAELCRQFSFNLLSKTDYATKKIIELLQAENSYGQIIGLLTASQISEKLSKQDKETVILFCQNPSSTLDSYHAIAVCLRYFCRLNKNEAYNILSKISTFENSEFVYEKYIFEEVKQEIAYLYG